MPKQTMKVARKPINITVADNMDEADRKYLAKLPVPSKEVLSEIVELLYEAAWTFKQNKPEFIHARKKGFLNHLQTGPASKWFSDALELRRRSSWPKGTPYPGDK